MSTTVAVAVTSQWPVTFQPSISIESIMKEISLPAKIQRKPGGHYSHTSIHLYKKKQLCGFQSASELYRLSNCHWSMNFSANFCG
jgi:hypothetical protein